MSSVKETQEPPLIHFYHCIELKTVFHKSVVFLIIRGIPPTSRQIQWNFQNKKLYNFWVTWAVPKKLKNLHLHRWKKFFFWKNCSWDEVAGLRIPRNSFLCISDIRCKPESLFRWLNWHEFVFVCSQRGPPKDGDFFF